MSKNSNISTPDNFIPIKVGMLLSYDYQLLRTSLPLIYERATQVFLAVDKGLRTWSGNRFSVDERFYEWLENFDTQKKIQLCEGDFYDPLLTPMENDTRERNMMADIMGEGGWHVQIDADEYMIDFDNFADFLLTKASAYLRHPEEPISVYADLVTLYKKTKNGYLYIPSRETGPVATRNPTYTKSRYQSFNGLVTTSKIVHQSWARPDEEIKQKLSNWGHRDDFNVESYFRFWQACDEHNYKYYNHFHPIYPELWHSLNYIPCESITDFIAQYVALHGIGGQEITCHYYDPTEALQKAPQKKWYKRLINR